MARYSKNPTRSKPQGAVSMPVPIGANDERRGRQRGVLRASTPEVLSPGRKKRVTKMEKLNPLV